MNYLILCLYFVVLLINIMMLTELLDIWGKVLTVTNWQLLKRHKKEQVFHGFGLV